MSSLRIIFKRTRSSHTRGTHRQQRHRPCTGPTCSAAQRTGASTSVSTAASACISSRAAAETFLKACAYISIAAGTSCLNHGIEKLSQYISYIYEAPLPPPAVARPSGTVQCRCDLSTVVAVAEGLVSAMHACMQHCLIRQYCRTALGSKSKQGGAGLDLTYLLRSAHLHGY